MSDLKLQERELLIPEYGTDHFVTFVVNKSFKFLSVLGTFTQNFELLSCINELSRLLRKAVEEHDHKNQEVNP